MTSGRRRQRRVFTAELKLEAIRHLRERKKLGVPVTQIALELDLGADVLRRGERQAKARGGASPTDVFPGHGRVPSDQEALRALQREVQRLRQENEFLKRAAAYFARESR